MCLEKRQKRSLKCIKIPLILQALKYAKVRNRFSLIKIRVVKKFEHCVSIGKIKIETKMVKMAQKKNLTTLNFDQLFGTPTGMFL